MRKVKFSPHLVENNPADTSLTDVELEGRRMDPKLPLIGAAIFAAVVAAGGWSLNGGSAAPTADASAIQLTASSTVAPPEAAATSVAPTRIPAGEASGATPSSASVVPSRTPQRNREREESNPGASGTPATRARERDD